MQSIRLFLFASIAVYFVALFWPKTTTPTVSPITITTPNPCTIRIARAYERDGLISVQIASGTPAIFTATWHQGRASAKADQRCWGGWCTLRIPPNTSGLRVQFDGCDPIHLR